MMRMSIPAGTRRWPIVVIAVLILLFIGFTVMSGFFVDLLWFREVKLSGVFWSVLRTKGILGLIFGLLFFALLYVNMLIVRWLTPTTRILTPEQEAVDRVRQSLEPYLKWLIPLAAAALALVVGLGVSRQWQVFLLWRNGSGLTFGSTEPIFHRDPAFYVFTLPWLRFLQGWLFSSLVGVTLIVGIAHFVWGGIQPQAPAFADKVDPAVRAHLSVLLGLIMLTKAWGYYIGRFDLLTSPRGVVEGASYTDVKAQLPALNFLAIVAVICAVLFLVNIRVRLWSLPVIAVGLLALVSVLLGTAYPAFVQQFSVKPQEQQRETPYIEHNIEGTRRAFGLDKITVSERPADPVVSSNALQENDATVSNIRLWRPTVLLENFQSLQRIRQYYEFKDVDVDRYNVSGEPRVLMVSGREISQNGIPTGGRTWQNTHLVYTHGYGAVAAQVNTATTEGAPLLTLRDIPPVGEPTIAEPRIYFGELNDVPFVVTNTGTKELDYEGASQEQQTTYTGYRRHPRREHLPARVVRVALQGHQPAHLRSDRLGQPDHDLPRPRGARSQAGAVPEVRRGSVPRGGGRQAHVDLGRLHHDERVPVLGVDGPQRRDPGEHDRDRELHPQLREGHRRCLQRRHEVLHLGRRKTPSSRRGRGRSPTCSRPRTTRRRTCRPTSATRRTSSRSRRRSSPRTT